MAEIQMMKEELKVVKKEWFSVWMLQKAQRRRGMEHFQYQTLRDVLKKEGVCQFRIGILSKQQNTIEF